MVGRKLRALCRGRFRRCLTPVIASSMLCVSLLPVVGLGRPVDVAAATGAVGARVFGSPFSPNGDGVRERARLRVQLPVAASIEVAILDFDGARVRTLHAPGAASAGSHEFIWNGRGDHGAMLPDGPYRFLVSVDGGAGTRTLTRAVTKARDVPYAPKPGVITVALDPGHGGTRTGAVAADGTREADLNLDEALRLAAMLRGAGIHVVMTRTTDTDVNVPAWDRNQDGQTEYWDELAARVDTATLARADLFLSIHNNIANDPSIGGPATLYSAGRTFSAESLRFGKLVQAAMLAALGAYRTATWKPYDHGVLTHDYYVLMPYQPPKIIRPNLMVGVLSEGMFVSQPYELELLHRADVRQQMAVAYFGAISRYLNSRSRAVSFAPAGAQPDTASEGGSLQYAIRVTNHGTRDLAGHRLTVSSVPAVPLYDGTGAAGTLLGQADVPTLHPAQSATVVVDVPAPPAGEWLIKFDAEGPAGARLSSHGNVPLQLPLSVSAPPPRPGAP